LQSRTPANGKISGIAIDVLMALAAVSGVNFRFFFPCRKEIYDAGLVFFVFHSRFLSLFLSRNCARLLSLFLLPSLTPSFSVPLTLSLSLSLAFFSRAVSCAGAR